MPKSRVQARMLLVGGLAVLWMGLVFARLAYLQLFCHAEYMARAQRQQQRTVEITPKRGAIYDRNGNTLAMSVAVDSAFAVPSELGDNAALAARLISGVLHIPRDVLEARFESDSTFVWIQRKLPPEKAEAIAALNLKGIYLQKENQRFYPKRDLAAHVLGFVDMDEKGLGGIEYELDSQIRGKTEKVVVMADARQRWFDGGAAQRDSGASVVLTLDTTIQYVAERELAAAIAKTHAIAGTAMVMNPNSGEILALANWPKFNPNAASDASPDSRMDRAVTALYEPGSTFKLITLAAAFDQNITKPSEIFDCENGRVYIAGHRIRDHKPFGLLTVSDILAQSSDVGAIKIALRLGAPKFYDYIRAFGFGALTGVDLPGESKGLLRRLENWTPISIGSISMGQEVGVTPIQLISAVSAIANGGMLYRPHVVEEVKRADAIKVTPAEGPNGVPEPRRVIRAETAATLRTLMEGVVLHGTGTLARLDGWTAAGKTGSAQKIDPATGRYSRTQLIASFTGFAPINNPAITVLVSLDSPVGQHEGGQVAAPVFKRIAEQVLAYLNVPRDVPINPRLVQASYKQTANDSSSLEDFTPTDFSAQPDQPPTESSTKGSSKIEETPAVTVAVEEGGDIPVPDFSGRTMRDVTEMCLRLGLDPVLIGSNLAVRQVPAAGAKVRRGAKVTVQFGTPEPKTAGLHQRSRN
ncbi:MAG TPA: penicillin-binding transpeptidase domain-containing protein [Candidatus Acidoferrales bacterium]|nr:penicillin-binding transpeptidase domain-containing protein [Candidatus Acidoferrales bacterium]